MNNTNLLLFSDMLQSLSVSSLQDEPDHNSSEWGKTERQNNLDNPSRVVSWCIFLSPQLWGDNVSDTVGNHDETGSCHTLSVT